MYIAFYRIHETLGEEDQAASAYTEYINDANRQGVSIRLLPNSFCIFPTRVTRELLHFISQWKQKKNCTSVLKNIQL